MMYRKVIDKEFLEKSKKHYQSVLEIEMDRFQNDPDADFNEYLCCVMTLTDILDEIEGLFEKIKDTDTTITISSNENFEYLAG